MGNFFRKESVPDLRVWSSQKLRAVQTSMPVKEGATYIEHWKALDEIDAVRKSWRKEIFGSQLSRFGLVISSSRIFQGICEGLTYEEIADRYPEQFASRDQVSKLLN